MPLGKFTFSFIVAFFFSTLGSFSLFSLHSLSEILSSRRVDSLLGARVNLNSQWVGSSKVTISMPILILAGHADSQGISGAGTAGEAVDIKGAAPMDPDISDELFWNLIIRDEIVRLGKEKGLNIRGYEPGIRSVSDGNNPITNWSVGATHVREGGYALEIHFDSYGKYGFGSGLIPAISTKLNTLDEKLARSFGRYPIFFRGGLGAPRRGIRVLEIGKLEGKLEKKLRNTKSRQRVVRELAGLVVNALVEGATPKANFN